MMQEGLLSLVLLVMTLYAICKMTLSSTGSRPYGARNSPGVTQRQVAQSPGDCVSTVSGKMDDHSTFDQALLFRIGLAARYRSQSMVGNQKR